VLLNSLKLPEKPQDQVVGDTLMTMKQNLLRLRRRMDARSIQKESHT